MKYCPLCRAEHRDEVSECATCQAALVGSLGAEEVRANPPWLLWMGKDSAEFDAVAGALREARVPAYAQERATGIVGSFLKEQSRVHVLQADLDRALEVVVAALAGQPARPGTLQNCYNCGGECRPTLAVCPRCKIVLLVEQVKEGTTSATSGGIASSGRKYCPVCDAEYTAEHERCSLCGVSLVPDEKRGRPLDEKERSEHIEMIWKGGDPVAVSEAVAALRRAGIPHDVKATHDHLVFGLAMPRPRYEIRVFQSDAEKARALLGGIQESLPFAVDNETQTEAVAEPKGAQQRPAEKWKSAQATVDVWSGEDAALAQVLEDCLRENHIGVHRAGTEPGTLHLLVMPPDVDAAREIIREVREGTAPA